MIRLMWTMWYVSSTADRSYILEEEFARRRPTGAHLSHDITNRDRPPIDTGTPEMSRRVADIPQGPQRWGRQIPLGVSDGGSSDVVPSRTPGM